jgi:UDP-N-acetylglucosamine acyltransferase
MTTNIHPTAIIDKAAQLDPSVTVGPYAIIGPNVKIGKNTKVHAHALIDGYTTIGEENEIYSFAAVGNPPQDLKYKGEPTTLEIGNKNIIREYVTMQPGTVQGGGKTVIGNGNLFMAYSHVAHDCIVGNSNVLANGTQLAGHVTIHNMAVLGGLVAVHQFSVIGDMVMVAGGSIIRKDVPPYCVADGFRASLRGLNTVALYRRNLPPNVRAAIKSVYKIVFMDQHPTIEIALSHIPKELMELKEIQYFTAFILESKRGVSRPISSISSKDEDNEDSH